MISSLNVGNVGAAGKKKIADAAALAVVYCILTLTFAEGSRGMPEFSKEFIGRSEDLIHCKRGFIRHDDIG